MPNHVFHTIQTQDPQAAKLIKAIVSKYKYGLCEAIKPMPNNEWSYDWCLENWGTKWGAYENHIDDELDSNNEITHLMYHFQTAWSSFYTEIEQGIVELLQNFIWEWEEEQGFGQYMEVVDGVVTVFRDWDIPEWQDTEHDNIFRLMHDYNGIEDKSAGWYYENDVYLTDVSFEEAVRIYEKELRHVSY